MKTVDNIFQVHERTEEMDFLLLLIRKLLHTNSQSVKVGSKYILQFFPGRINFYMALIYKGHVLKNLP